MHAYMHAHAQVRQSATGLVLFQQSVKTPNTVYISWSLLTHTQKQLASLPPSRRQRLTLQQVNEKFFELKGDI